MKKNKLAALVRTGLSMALLGVGGWLSTANGQSAEGGGAPAVEADARVKKTLDAAGLKYVVTPLGNFRLSYKLSDGRSHWIFVSSPTDKFSKLETRRLWATVMKSKDPLSRETASQLLMDNIAQKLGAFELSKGGDGTYKVSYSARVEADCGPDALRDAIRLVLHAADAKEKELTGKDEY
jgi:hypothetical protein